MTLDGECEIMHLNSYEEILMPTNPQDERSSDPDQADSREQFLENFDGTGPAEPTGAEHANLGRVENQVRRVANKLNLEIRKRHSLESAMHATIQSLEKENQSLKTENSRLADRLEQDWRLPNVVFIILSTLGAILVILLGVHITTQFFTTSELSKRADEVRGELVEAKKQRDTFQQTLADYDKQIASRTSKNFESMELLLDETKASMEKYRTSLNRAQSSLTAVNLTTSSAQRANALMGLAQNQLVYKHDPRRALSLVENALEDLDGAVHLLQQNTNQPGQNDSDQSNRGRVQFLQEMRFPLWALQNECNLKLKRYSEVERVATLMNMEGCDCVDGEYFLGIAALHQAMDQQRPAERQRLVDAAIASLEKATGRKSVEIFTHVYLAAAYLENENYQSASNRCDEFLGLFSAEASDRNRLDHTVRAQIRVATIIRNVSLFLLDQSIDLPATTCDFDAGAMDEIDGMLFENVLDRIIRERDRLTSNDPLKPFFLGAYCANAIGGIRRACTQGVAVGPCGIAGGCGATGLSPLLQEVYQRYQLSPIPPMPKKSRNSQFGKMDEGKLVMRVQRLRVEARTRTVIREGVVRDEAYQVLLPYTEDLVFDPNENLPEDYYININAAGSVMVPNASPDGLVPADLPNAIPPSPDDT